MSQNIVAVFLFSDHLKPAWCWASATTSPGSLRPGLVGEGVRALLAHQRSSRLGGAGLLCLGSGEGSGLGAGLELLLVAALSAAGKGQEGDGDDNGSAEDDGDDDAADVEVVLLDHADGLTEGVERAHEARGTVGLGHLGGDTCECSQDTLIGGNVARRRLDGGCSHTLEAVTLAHPVGWERCRLGVSDSVRRLDRAAKDAAVSLLQVSQAGELVTSPQGIFGLGDGLVDGASGVGITGLEVAFGFGVAEGRQAVLEGDVLAAVRVSGQLLAVLAEASCF